jgi:Na+/melibiose symporter-like transporter
VSEPAAGASQRLRPLTLFAYAAPAVAFAMPTIPIYVYLPTLYAQHFGLGLAATGLILLVARSLDVVTDPIIGVASDRIASRFGRRKPWIVAGALLSAISLVQLLDPPAGAGGWHLLIWINLLNLGWTLIAVPFTAWGAELSGDYHERARITGAREAGMVLGVLIAGALPAAAAASGRGEAEGLAAVAWLAVIVGLPTVVLLMVGVPDRLQAAATGRSENLLAWRAYAAALANKPFLRLLAGWFVNGLANGLPAVLFPLYLQHALQADALERGVLIMTYFLAGVAAIPLWVWLSRRFGKHRAWCWAMMVACAAFVWVPFLEPRAIEAFFVVCVVTGIAFGADIALPPAMQADVVDLDSLRTGKRRAGLYFALWSMSTKLALAAAVGIAFPALAAFGFSSDGGNDAIAITALAVIYALVPTVLKGCAIAVIWSHPITARRQQIIRRRLDALARRACDQGRTDGPDYGIAEPLPASRHGM